MSCAKTRKERSRREESQEKIACRMSRVMRRGGTGHPHLREAVPEKTEEDEEKETMGQRHRGKQRVSIDRKTKGRVTDEEASHVPGTAWLIKVRERAGEGRELLGGGRRLVGH
ncbi:hypothetical protein NDU88_008086 [Pleurodeles waltl]|uniref:Uncharacterized protein n=1 Tax=Pleurodeles waltl TaxID=8319 RepID=A0AAV7NXW2_PLEWA|nr:hypothetical protein NDU88_008086 [Pleurodeles waltl]